MDQKRNLSSHSTSDCLGIGIAVSKAALRVYFQIKDHSNIEVFKNTTDNIESPVRTCNEFTGNLFVESTV